MQEPLRSQYLAALGIDSYVPRFILPGAKISESCEWFNAPTGSVHLSAVIEGKVITPSGAGHDQKALSENIVQRSVESTPKSLARVIENVTAKISVAQSETGPQFALSIVLATGGILLIDAAPVSSVERTGFQKLLSNMLPALRPEAAQYVLDVFIWPLTRQPKISRDAEAAKETLSAYLNKQIKQRAIDVVLLLGEAAQQWCILESDVRLVKSTSLLACVHDPALKRPLWNDIRHLAER